MADDLEDALIDRAWWNLRDEPPPDCEVLRCPLAFLDQGLGRFLHAVVEKLVGALLP